MSHFDEKYTLDVFRQLRANDIRHAAIGPGTANSHGYERTHIDSLRNTFDLALAYIME
jgi:putative aminopeptidase FrvX